MGARLRAPARESARAQTHGLQELHTPGGPTQRQIPSDVPGHVTLGGKAEIAPPLRVRQPGAPKLVREKVENPTDPRVLEHKEQLAAKRRQERGGPAHQQWLEQAIKPSASSAVTTGTHAEAGGSTLAGHDDIAAGWALLQDEKPLGDSEAPSTSMSDRDLATHIKTTYIPTTGSASHAKLEIGPETKTVEDTIYMTREDAEQVLAGDRTKLDHELVHVAQWRQKQKGQEEGPAQALDSLDPPVNPKRAAEVEANDRKKSRGVAAGETVETEAVRERVAYYTPTGADTEEDQDADYGTNTDTDLRGDSDYGTSTQYSPVGADEGPAQATSSESTDEACANPDRGSAAAANIQANINIITTNTPHIYADFKQAVDEALQSLKAQNAALKGRQPPAWQTYLLKKLKSLVVDGIEEAIFEGITESAKAAGPLSAFFVGLAKEQFMSRLDDVAESLIETESEGLSDTGIQAIGNALINGFDGMFGGTTKIVDENNPESIEALAEMCQSWHNNKKAFTDRVITAPMAEAYLSAGASESEGEEANGSLTQALADKWLPAERAGDDAFILYVASDGEVLKPESLSDAQWEVLQDTPGFLKRHMYKFLQEDGKVTLGGFTVDPSDPKKAAHGIRFGHEIYASDFWRDPNSYEFVQFVAENNPEQLDALIEIVNDALGRAQGPLKVHETDLVDADRVLGGNQDVMDIIEEAITLKVQRVLLSGGNTVREVRANGVSDIY